MQHEVMAEEYGPCVEFHNEYIKLSVWEALRAAQADVTGKKKKEANTSKYTTGSPVPDHLRKHPYLRSAFPTLEVILVICASLYSVIQASLYRKTSFGRPYIEASLCRKTSFGRRHLGVPIYRRAYVGRRHLGVPI